MPDEADRPARPVGVIDQRKLGERLMVNAVEHSLYLFKRWIVLGP